MKKLSVIIPVYNSCLSICKCLDSVLFQDCSSNFEIIVINDGSEDSTSKILQEYSSKFENVIVINTEHCGAGYARNIGLEHASGDYCLFLDSDDYLVSSALNVINVSLDKNPVDILIYGYRYFSEEKDKFYEMSNRDFSVYNNLSNVDCTINKESFPQIFQLIAYPWNKVFKTSFLRDNSVCFMNTRVQNDLFFVMKSFVKADTIKFLQHVLYVHVVDQNKDQISDINDYKVIDCLKVVNNCICLFREEKMSHAQMFYIHLFMVDLLLWRISRLKSKLRDIFIKFTVRYLNNINYILLISIYNHEIIKIWRSNQILSEIINRRKFDKDCGLLLSIIIPVYNVEKYLYQCLLSVVNQTLDPNTYEVILIDDCSTDSSAQICNEFCCLHKNFRLIKLGKNTPGGAGIPSNIGISKAKGMYIGFVDSDDYVEPTMFESMLRKGILEQSDVVVCNFSILNQITSSIEQTYDINAWNTFYKSYISKENIERIKDKLLNISPVPWRKIYKRSFMNVNNICYPEGDFFFEDNPLHWFTTVKANSISAVNEVMIVHRRNRPNQTMSSNNDKLLDFTVHDKIIYDFLVENGIEIRYRTEFLRYLYNQKWIINRFGKRKLMFINRISESFRGKYMISDIKCFRKKYKIDVRNQYRFYYALNGKYRFGIFVGYIRKNILPIFMRKFK